MPCFVGATVSNPNTVSLLSHWSKKKQQSLTMEKPHPENICNLYLNTTKSDGVLSHNCLLDEQIASVICSPRHLHDITTEIGRGLWPAGWKETGIHTLGTMNVCTCFHGNSINCCWAINLIFGIRGQVKGSPKSVDLIRWDTGRSSIRSAVLLLHLTCIF